MLYAHKKLEDIEKDYNTILHTFGEIKRNYRLRSKVYNKIKLEDNKILLNCIETLIYLAKQESVQEEFVKSKENMKKSWYSQIDNLGNEIIIYLAGFINSKLKKEPLKDRLAKEHFIPN